MRLTGRPAFGWMAIGSAVALRHRPRDLEHVLDAGAAVRAHDVGARRGEAGHRALDAHAHDGEEAARRALERHRGHHRQPRARRPSPPSPPASPRRGRSSSRCRRGRRRPRRGRRPARRTPPRPRRATCRRTARGAAPTARPRPRRTRGPPTARLTASTAWRLTRSLLAVEAVELQAEGGPAERVGRDEVGAGLDVEARDLLDHLRPLEREPLRRLPRGQAARHELRPPRPVADEDVAVLQPLQDSRHHAAPSRLFTRSTAVAASHA